MTIQALVQLKGEKEPEKHVALVIEDATTPCDLAVYRNALTSAAKVILTSDDGEYFLEECFFLLQLAEYIGTSLDTELEDKMRLLHDLRQKGGAYGKDHSPLLR